MQLLSWQSLAFTFSCFAFVPMALAGSEPGPEDVHKSWEGAHVYVPGKLFRQSVQDIAVEKPLPVVIYLHGCAGVQKSETQWGLFLKGNGYIAVILDSFARNRPASCDPATRRYGMWPGASAFRNDELAYAYRKVKEAAWADQGSIFLMGHSQGGYLVATSKLQQQYAGMVVSGWRCAGQDPRWSGLHMPRNIPVLVLNHVTDPWYPQENDRKCSEYFDGRAQAQEVVLPGHDHATFEPKAQEALLSFLRQYSANTPRPAESSASAAQ